MTLSMRPVGRLVLVALVALILVGAMVPARVGADFAAGDSPIDSSIVVSNDEGRQGVGFAARPCIDKDARNGEHHEDTSTSDTAEATEKGARKHSGDGNHESAARAYEYAACLWDMISEFDKAEAAYEKAAAEYEKAAEKHDEAGDKTRAEEARKNAERIRKLLE